MVLRLRDQVMLLKLNIWGVVCWHLLTVFVTGSGSAKAPNASNEVRFLFRCDNYELWDGSFENELQPTPVSYSSTTLNLVGQTKYQSLFFFGDQSSIDR